VVIRWNPDNYKPPNNEKEKCRKDRLKILRKTIKTVLKNLPKDLIYIIYFMMNIIQKL
jgi:hypothetical protein